MTVDSPPVSPHPYHQRDISAPEFWDNDFRTRDDTFAALRAETGLSWHRPIPGIFPHEETGYWAATRHADVKYISQHTELFGSSLGVSVDPMPAEIQRGISFFLTMDAPEHTRYRRLISAAFTPRQIRRIENQIRANAREVVDGLLADLASGDQIDFVASCSGKLPMRTISDMIGIDPADQEAVAYAAESLFAGSDDEYAALEDRAVHLMTQLGVLTGAGVELAKLRRAEPHEDLMTEIVNAEVDGHRLSDEEIGAFMVLLGSAGNDTTKQATSHAFKALIDRPEQRVWLAADFDNRIDAAVEEFVRWSTPVIAFARHALVDTEVAGTPIKAGEKVALFYCSANRDEAVFDRPHDFDISRAPNPHHGYGGGGAHFCLGNQLARMELRHLFYELVTRVPEVTLGEPEYVHSTFVHGIKRMPVSLA
ncbi:cytochrome P450 [Mycobacterium talmoniae]|uniref:Cytochrome n=1 Tax=Mycobacterium talmoniae TaxID=1858794 RepID=A0A1S1N845_9MYCO|nr:MULTISPECIES: cytochrome P450 [Mycobacterium]OHU95660.1 cytochrome [Mycobacterium talmoniae]PQM44703.1 Methyl-branched lipid omega-hydroxylase [Mycobacterium talmoniae]TDH51260.1 cytochrome P450 [Mycobacterium eburneum]